MAAAQTRSQKEADDKFSHRFDAADDLRKKSRKLGFVWPSDNRAQMAKYAKEVPSDTNCPACCRTAVEQPRCKCIGPHWRSNTCANGHNWWPSETRVNPTSTDSEEDEDEDQDDDDSGHGGQYAFARFVGVDRYMKYLLESAELWVTRMKTNLVTATELIEQTATNGQKAAVKENVDEKSKPKKRRRG
jgi:hypothetical protein